MTDLVYLDVETTGLDDTICEIWEIAWVVNEDPKVQSVVVPHSIVTADEKALNMNGYWDRAPGASLTPWADIELRKIIEGNTLVCANPPFDRGFLKKRWGIEPWHYRSIDLESMAMGILEHDRPRGLKDISDELRELGYNIAEPSHAAWVDVVVLRESYRALRDIQKLKNDALLRINQDNGGW